MPFAPGKIWLVYGAFVSLLISFCTLADFFMLKNERSRVRVALYQWWSKLLEFDAPTRIHGVNAALTRTLNVIFDIRYVSARGALMCALMSCASLLFVLLIAVVTDMSFEVYDIGIMMPVYWFVAANFLAGVLCLAKVRWLLRHGMGVASITGVVLVAICDVLSTIGAFLLSYVTCAIPWFRLGTLSFLHNWMVPMHNWHMVLSARLALFATFWPSVAWYAFVITALRARAIGSSTKRMMLLLERLEGDDTMFSTIGVLLSAFIGIITALHTLYAFAYKV